MPLQHSPIARLSDDLTELMDSLKTVVSEDLLEMHKPNRQLHGTVHYFITSAFDSMQDVIDARTDLEKMAEDAGIPVTVSFELYLRSKRVWKMRLDRPPSTI